MKSQPISNSKAVQNLLMLLKVKCDNAWDRYKYNKEQYGEENTTTERTYKEFSTLNNIINLIEDKKYFKEIANIYNLELLK